VASEQTWAVRILVTLRRPLYDAHMTLIQSQLSRNRAQVVIEPSGPDDLVLAVTLTGSDAAPTPNPLTHTLNAFDAAMSDAGADIDHWEAIEIWLPSPDN
jgi:hypothetical protein